MRFNKQTRLHKGIEKKEDRGNCFPTVISCFLDMEVEDVIQIQEYYDSDEWAEILQDWLNKRGWRWRYLTEEDNILDKYILAVGLSPRNNGNNELTHVVIYKNGELAHDPHPDGSGILDERGFEILERI